MENSLLLGLVSYVCVMSITPGPNNVMLMSSGLLFGFRRTCPHMLGIPLGMIAQLWLVGAGLGVLFAMEPGLQLALKAAGSLYLLWLAARLWRAAEMEEARASRPITLLQAVAFQFVNPKAWLAAATAIAAFTPPGGGYLSHLLVICLVFVAVGLPCIAIWAGFGAALKPWLRRPGVALRINRAMAALTGLTIILFWI